MPRQLKFDEIDTAEHGDWIEYYSGGLEYFYDEEYVGVKLVHNKVVYTSVDLLTGVRQRRWLYCCTDVVTQDTYDGGIYSTENLSEILRRNNSISFETLEKCVEHALQEVEEYKEEELARWDRIVSELKSISKGSSANE